MARNPKRNCALNVRSHRIEHLIFDFLHEIAVFRSATLFPFLVRPFFALVFARSGQSQMLVLWQHILRFPARSGVSQMQPSREPPDVSSCARGVAGSSAAWSGLQCDHSRAFAFRVQSRSAVFDCRCRALRGPLRAQAVVLKSLKCPPRAWPR